MLPRPADAVVHGNECRPASRGTMTVGQETSSGVYASKPGM